MKHLAVSEESLGCQMNNIFCCCSRTGNKCNGTLFIHKLGFVAANPSLRQATPSASWGCSNKSSQMGSLNNGNLLSHRLEARSWRLRSRQGGSLLTV